MQLITKRQSVWAALNQIANHLMSAPWFTGPMSLNYSFSEETTHHRRPCSKPILVAIPTSQPSTSAAKQGRVPSISRITCLRTITSRNREEETTPTLQQTHTCRNTHFPTNPPPTSAAKQGRVPSISRTTCSPTIKPRKQTKPPYGEHAAHRSCNISWKSC